MTSPDSPVKLPPVTMVRALAALRNGLLRLHRNLFPGTAVLFEQFQHFWLLPSLYVAARLDLAGTLRTGPLTPDEIADRVHADRENTARLLRTLAGNGIFRRRRDGRYTLNPMARGLLDGPGSLRHTLLHHLGPVNWNLMTDLEHAVITGSDAFAARYGMNIYDYLRLHPEEAEVFDRSMTNLSDLGLAPLLQVFRYGRYRKLVDVGGGEGYMLAHIIRSTQDSRGILFDTPGALTRAPELLERYGVEHRIEVVPGDFFKSVPPGGDLYILKNIIHNWDDDRSVQLLQNIAAAMTAEAELLIMEMVVPEGNAQSPAKLLDIQMMASMPGGKERTAAEYRRLLEQAGFTLHRIIPSIAPVSLIAARRNR